MLVSVDWRAIAADVPAGSLLRIRADQAARIWSDGADARFAAEFGIPYSDGLFRMLAGVADRDPGAPEPAYVEGADPVPFDGPHGPLLQLGLVYGAELYVCLPDGTIWVADPDSEHELELIHRDLSSLSYLLYVIKAEKPRPEERPTPNDWADVEDLIREAITPWDDLPFGGEGRFWDRYLDSYPML
ncbi:hypothetical protein GCM10023322_43340 [Rugosimonospora acidiphila]|uniref:SUKH-4 immunity protein n=1 Tax=Rugosimonospora acidiphila TaxID=556531 RepID=A0ABP9S0G8_9ACTN